MLAFSNQACGINAITLYAKQLFLELTGGKEQLSQLFMVLLGLVQVLAVFFGANLLDNLPKRWFLLTS